MSKKDRAAFLQAIQSAPGDPTPRLVFADYLDEQGDPDGELVRLLCEVQGAGYEDGPAWERMEALTCGRDAELRRLGERDGRLYLSDMLERHLSRYEQDHPGDFRPRQFIEAIRRLAPGTGTQEELEAAGRAEARSDFCIYYQGFGVADKEIEFRRWPLCRAVEYRLGFVPLPTFERE